MKLLVYGWNFDTSGRCYDLPIVNSESVGKLSLTMNHNGIIFLSERSKQQHSQLNTNNKEDCSIVLNKTELVSIQRNVNNHISNDIIHNTATSIIDKQNKCIPKRDFQCISMSDNISAFSMDNSLFIQDEINVNYTINRDTNNICQDRKVACKSLHLPYVISKISCGYNHCLVMTKDCSYSYGSSLYGVLGLGKLDIEYIHDLQPILLPTQDQMPLDIAAGPYHSAVITQNGYVYTFGNGAYYRLGHGNTDNCYLPTKIQHDNLQGLGQFQSDGSSTGVTHVSCGMWHTIVLADATSEVFGWGWNQYGQLGPSEEGGEEKEEEGSGESNSHFRHTYHRESTQIKEISNIGNKRKELFPTDLINHKRHQEEIITIPSCITHLFTPFLLTDNCRLDHLNLTTSAPFDVSVDIDDIFIQSIQCGTSHTAVLLSSGQVIIMGKLGMCCINTNHSHKQINNKIHQFINNINSTNDLISRATIAPTIDRLDNKSTTVSSNQSYLTINTYQYTTHIPDNNCVANNMSILPTNNNQMIACYDDMLCILTK